VATKSDGTLWAWGDNSISELGYLGRTPLPVAAQLGPIAAAECGQRPYRADQTRWNALDVGQQREWPARDRSQRQWPASRAGAARSRLYVVERRSGSLPYRCGEERCTLWTWGYSTSTASSAMARSHNATALCRSAPPRTGRRSLLADFNTIALKTDGTLWAWGYNSDGQLGNGVADGTTPHPTPTQVGTATNWTHVVTHGYHILATRSDGTLWGWGYNFYGQVGNGTTTSPITTPVQIGTATDW